MKKYTIAFITLTLIAVLVNTVTVSAAPTATFFVNSTSDLPDVSPGDGLCADINLECGLRAAIMQANATTAHDEIRFSFTATTQFLPNSEYPAIIHPVTIDGVAGNPSTCPNGTTPANLLITLNGVFASSASGLRLAEYSGASADGSIIRGLNFLFFQEAGIKIESADNVRIECNHIGVPNNNTAASGNQNGIIVTKWDTSSTNSLFNTENTVIGGDSEDRNVISGNSVWGIMLLARADDTEVVGNYIGTDKTGSSAIGNDSGMIDGGVSTAIGGIFPSDRNIISGNEKAGIFVDSIGKNGFYANNYIGTSRDGNGPLPNARGIEMRESGAVVELENILIGSPIAPNRIAYNSGSGIALYESASATAFIDGVSIRYNKIYDNGGLGIDLGSIGVNANDFVDNDAGANGLQNYPTINSAQNTTATGSAISKVTVSGTLFSNVSSSFDIDVYYSTSCDPSGYGEGEFYVGSFPVNTNNAQGSTAFTHEFTQGSTTMVPPDGTYVTATAVDTDGNTSEFSACQEVVGNAATIKVNEVTDDDDGSCDSLEIGNCTLREAINAANAVPLSNDFAQITFDVEAPIYIKIETPLPTITRRVKLIGLSDDTECPNEFEAPASNLVHIDYIGTASNVTGLRLGAGSDNSVIDGVAITNFTSHGVLIDSNDSAVYCSHLGVEPDGSTAGGNKFGVTLIGNNNQIGGALQSRRNVISANTDAGVFINTGDGNLIIGNYVGIGGDGDLPLGNGGTGVFVRGDNNVVGNGTADGRNIISESSLQGIFVDGDGNSVRGNYIGTDWSGTRNRGNTLHGVRLLNSMNTLVGGEGTADGNTISGNGRNGITVEGTSSDTKIVSNRIGQGSDGATMANGHNAVYITGSGVTGTQIVDNTLAGNNRNGVLITDDSVGNTISRNAIYDNGELGIDLDNDGVTANDDGDGDGGTNRQMNFPELLIAADHISIVGDFNSLSGPTYTLEFFHNPDCTTVGGRYGQNYLGSHEVTIGASNDFRFTAAFLQTVPVGDYVTATATHPAGDTSEFSACIEVTDAFIVNTAEDFEQTTNDGVCNAGTGSALGGVQCSLRQAILEANPSGNNAQDIFVAIEGEGRHYIEPTTALPNITKRINLDGASYEILDSAMHAIIDISGESTPINTSGLRFVAGSDRSTVSFLNITNFPSTGVVVTSDSNLFSRMGIGTRYNPITQVFVRAENGSGIRITGVENRVEDSNINYNEGDGILIDMGNSGGVQAVATTIARVSIRDNDGDGIHIEDSSQINITDSFVWANDEEGIRIIDSNLVSIGGSVFGGGAAQSPGNSIYSNGGNGISVIGNANLIGIANNQIGIRLNQFEAGNLGAGIFFDSIGTAYIGGNGGLGNTTDDYNTIAHNGGDGIRIMSPQGQNPTNSGDKVINGNHIYDNGELGIDFGADGPLGLSGLKKPIIGSSSSSGQVVVNFLNYDPGDYIMHVYNSDDCDSSGYGEGERVAGRLFVEVPASGDVVATFSGPSQTVGSQTSVVLIQYDTKLSSEFSLCKAVTAGVPTAVAVSNQLSGDSNQLSVVMPFVLLLLGLTVGLVWRRSW